MKAYTDINQSKKLAEILLLESADMTYCAITEGMREKMIIKNWEVNVGLDIAIKEKLFSYRNGYMVPCWSLAALLSVLPTTIGNFFEKTALRLRMDKGENDFNIWYENFDLGDVAEGLDVIEDNPIDACYAMIVKLHRQKLL